MDLSGGSITCELGRASRKQAAARDRRWGDREQESQPAGSEAAFAELVLLMPRGQLDALERSASDLGITTGRLLRRLVGAFLGGLDDAQSLAGAAGSGASVA